MSLKVSKFFTTNKLIFLALFVIACYIAPYYILGENTHIRVHDNLDSNIVWYKMLADSGMIFAGPDALLPYAINGLPRSALPSALDGAVWLYALFPPMIAYTISQTIMRIVAFFGMYLLLKKHMLQQHTHPVIPIGAALCFAMLPFWPSGVLSIAGIPLALHAFLVIRKQGWKTPKRYWFILLFIPFLSSFILTFLFFLALLGILWLIDWIRTKQFQVPFFLAIAGMTTIYLLKNYLLIYAMFLGNSEPTHRNEMNLGHLNLQETWDLFIKNFIVGHTHALDEHQTIVLPVVLLTLLLAIIFRSNMKWMIGLLILNALFSFMYALWYWEGLRILKDHFSLFNTFNFARIHFMRPVLWYASFAIALSFLWRQFRLGKWVVIFLLAAQCTLLYQLTEDVKYREAGTPTFKEFYAEDLFKDIQDYIGKDQSSYRVASIGLHPAISQYNGFYTLDTYNNTIPLDYKHDFRTIIAPELAKNKTLQNYFDTWGSRLYMYSSELGKHYMFTKHSKKEIQQFSIDTAAFRKLGGEYILSAVPIQQHHLHFEKSFTTAEAPWKIHLYRVQAKK